MLAHMKPRPGLAHAVLLSDGHVFANEFARDDTGARGLLVAEQQDNPLWDAFSRIKASTCGRPSGLQPFVCDAADP